MERSGNGSLPLPRASESEDERAELKRKRSFSTESRADARTSSRRNSKERSGSKVSFPDFDAEPHDNITVESSSSAAPSESRQIDPPRSRSRSKETTQSTSFYAERVKPITPELLCFLAKRLPTPMSQKMNRNQKLEKAGKTINYEKDDPEMKAGLDGSRKVG